MKRMKYMAVLLVCAGIANATIITPSSVTYTGTATEYGPLSNEGAIIDESGLSETPTDANLNTVTHNNDFVSTVWTTTDPNGGTGDWFDPAEGTIVMEFDLGATYANINTFVSWPYHGQGNSISSVELYFSADGGVTTNSTQTVAVPLTDGSHAEIISITPVAANHVIMVVTDNHFGNVAGGGDRVGIGEIRFVDSYVPPVLPPEITSFTASPSIVTNGGTTTLAWTTAHADTASIDQGVGAVPTTGSTQLVITAEITYTLMATGSGGSTNQSVTVSLQEPVTGTIIQPISITGNIEGDAGSSIADLTSGSGLSASLVNGTEVTSALATTHVLTGTGHEDSWTKSTADGNPVFSMNLGSEQSLDAAVLWQYGNNGGGGVWDSGNHTRQFELIFHTAAEGPTFDFDSEAAEFSGTMDYIDAGGADSTASNLAQLFTFPVETAQYVGLRIVSNWGGEEVDGNVISGGDRFGLGEIRFAEGATFVADPIGNITISGPVSITGGQGMILSWDTSDGQNYDVQSKSNLITQSAWQTITNVTGTGGSITVTTAVDNAENFYQVETPTP